MNSCSPQRSYFYREISGYLGCKEEQSFSPGCNLSTLHIHLMSRVGDSSRGKIAGMDSCLCEETGSVGKIRGNSKWAHRPCNGFLSCVPVTIPMLDGCGEDIRNVQKVIGMIKPARRLSCSVQNGILIFCWF